MVRYTATEDDARLYGILLGDDHLSKDGMQWASSGNPQADNDHLEFVRSLADAAFAGKPVAAPLMCKSIGRRAWACAMAPRPHHGRRRTHTAL